jgi:hypothetical protein
MFSICKSRIISGRSDRQVNGLRCYPGKPSRAWITYCRFRSPDECTEYSSTQTTILDIENLAIILWPRCTPEVRSSLNRAGFTAVPKSQAPNYRPQTEFNSWYNRIHSTRFMVCLIQKENHQPLVQQCPKTSKSWVCYLMPILIHTGYFKLSSWRVDDGIETQRLDSVPKNCSHRHMFDKV